MESGLQTYLSCSSDETIAIGYKLGAGLKSGDVVCFMGELAAGKTTFIKGLVEGVAHYSPNNVNSPTFAILNVYQGQKTVYHFDLYRLGDVDEFLAMGFEEFLFTDGICCIEWAERIQDILPLHHWIVRLEHAEENKRHIVIERT